MVLNSPSCLSDCTLGVADSCGRLSIPCCDSLSGALPATAQMQPVSWIPDREACWTPTVLVHWCWCSCYIISRWTLSRMTNRIPFGASIQFVFGSFQVSGPMFGGQRSLRRHRRTVDSEKNLSSVARGHIKTRIKSLVKGWTPSSSYLCLFVVIPFQTQIDHGGATPIIRLPSDQVDWNWIFINQHDLID
jgi:hypothetical protein